MPEGVGPSRPAIGVGLGYPGTSFAESVSLARAADDAGLDLVAVGDASADNFALLGAIAAHTERLGLVSAIATWTRTPVTTALASKTVSNLASGRYRLGLGPMPRAWAQDWHGMEYSRPVDRMRDFVAAVRAAWNADMSHPADHDGPYYRIRGFPGHPGACSHSIPLLLAATGPRMSELAAEIADGVIFNCVHSRQWLEGVGAQALHAGLQRAGRSRDEIEVGILRICAIDEDRSRAYDLARRGLAFYFGVPYFADLLRYHGFDAEWEAGSAAFARGDYEGQLAALTDDIVRALAVAGTPADVISQVASYAGVVDWIELAASVGHPPEVSREQIERVIAVFGTAARSAAPASAGGDRPATRAADLGVSVRRTYVETPHGQIHCRIAGSGRPLLLLHQTASSSMMWERVMRTFPGGHRLIAMDTPGFGISDPPPSRPADGLAYYARRVLEVLDVLGIDRASIAGHHTGAMIAAEIAATNPERVESLVLLGAVVIGSDEERDRRLQSIDRWNLDAHGDFVVDTLLPRLRLSVTTDDPEHMRAELAAYLQAGPAYWWAYDAVFRYDAVDRLPLIAAPTLCAVGDREPDDLITWTRQAADLIPGASFVEVPEATAEMVLQNPQLVTDLICGFLARGEAAPAAVATPD